jgi:hypothetical protein
VLCSWLLQGCRKPSLPQPGRARQQPLQQPAAWHVHKKQLQHTAII